MTNADIIDPHELTFDPGDPLNGSLYLCQIRGQSDAALEPIIAWLRAAELWSEIEAKQVPNDHRAAYKAQLQFVEAVTYAVAGSKLTIARFDHEKFPSDAGRWDAWKAAFDGQYGRI